MRSRTVSRATLGTHAPRAAALCNSVAAATPAAFFRCAQPTTVWLVSCTGRRSYAAGGACSDRLRHTDPPSASLLVQLAPPTLQSQRCCRRPRPWVTAPAAPSPHGHGSGSRPIPSQVQGTTAQTRKHAHTMPTRSPHGAGPMDSRLWMDGWLHVPADRLSIPVELRDSC